MAVGDDIKNSAAQVDAATESTKQYAAATVTAKDVLDAFGRGAQNAGTILRQLTTELRSVATAQQNSHLMMQESTKQLAVLGSGVLGASKTFEAFGEKMDTTGISSFNQQIDELIATASRSSNAIDGLGQIASAFGLNAVKKATESVEEFASRIAKTAKGMLEGQDAALRFQNGFLQMSAASGNLGRVFQQTGGDLQHINELMQTQSQILKDGITNTGNSYKATVEWYSALGQIPGYLNEVIRLNDAGSTKINMLTAAMKLAHGTGQDQRDILGDLSTAYATYGASGEKALDFTARIADLSQKYNARLQDTREYMNSVASSFKFLGENIDSSAGVLESYLSRLRDTGLGTKAAIEITEGLTDSLAKMSMAQKAFLSARTGGPGGLMGAIQIEQEIRGGHMDQVMKRVETALKQQFGRIVTQQEAATSEQAASQFTRQRMFLMQGPFGALTGGDEGKATRLLEAMGKPGGAGGITQEKAADLLGKDLKRGSDVEQKSYTALTRLNADVEASKMLLGIIALGVTQRIATPIGGVETEMGRKLLGGIKDAMGAGAKETGRAGETAQDRGSLYTSENIRGIFQSIDGLKATGRSLEQAAGITVTAGHQMTREHQNAQTRHAAEVRRTSAQNMQNQPITVKHDTRVADTLYAASKKPPTTPPQNITVTLNSVCPDCHKKYVTNQQQTAINNAPGQFDAGF